MIRYRLDDLGWYQFEWLVQSILKAEIGLNVQSWGGNGDHGVDAYCTTSLKFPSKDEHSKGPYIFQIKYVQNANSKGAKPKNALLDAVRKEVKRIQSRTVQKAPWKDLKYYVLITNSPLSSAIRRTINDILRRALSDVQFSSLGATDICDLLDKHQKLRQAFPQLLSLRDLDFLLQSAVNKEIIERSQAAIESARDVVASFVPTSAYEKAWRILKEYNFAVLEGPPEMGKSAIAWMIALTGCGKTPFFTSSVAVAAVAYLWTFS